MASISQDTLKLVISSSDPDATKALVEEAEALGKRLTRRESRLTTSQIRALFGEVRQIEAQLSAGDDGGQQRALRKLLLLKPKMAYRAKREGRGVAELASVLDPAIDLVVDGSDPKGNFGRFVDFFEAVLAYHRAAGGN